MIANLSSLMFGLLWWHSKAMYRRATSIFRSFSLHLFQRRTWVASLSLATQLATDPRLAYLFIYIDTHTQFLPTLCFTSPSLHVGYRTSSLLQICRKISSLAELLALNSAVYSKLWDEFELRKLVHFCVFFLCFLFLTPGCILSSGRMNLCINV